MNRLRFVVLGLLGAITVSCAIGYAQQPLNTAAPMYPGGAFAPFAQGSGSAYGAQIATFNHPSGADAQLARKYVKAEKEEDKRELRKQITELLGKQFDQHVKQQENELDELEKQVASLKALLRKRKEARTTIIDRRLEQLIQEAEGLGWNTSSGPRGGFGATSGRGAYSGTTTMTPEKATSAPDKK
jgi:hypothetical protein